MKKLLGFILALIVLAGCSSSNDVANNGLFQKRKHRTGFHFNGLAHKGTQRSAEPMRAEFGVEKSIGKEEYAARTESSVFDEQSFDSEPLALKVECKRETRKMVSSVQQELKGRKAEVEAQIEPKFERSSDQANEDNDPLMTSAILSLVFAGLAVLSLTVPVVNIVFSVLAFVFGRRAMKSEDENVQMMGKIGYIVGGIAGILSILYTLFIIGYILLIFFVFGF